MPDPTMLLLAGGAGVLLGVLFFGGLWWTVQRGLASRRPALWFVGSFVLRTSVVLAGMYVVSGGRWEALLASLVGVVVAPTPGLTRRRSPLPCAGRVQAVLGGRSDHRPVVASVRRRQRTPTHG